MVVNSLDVIDQAAGDSEHLADFVAGFSGRLWKIFHNRSLGAIAARCPLPLLRPLVVKIASPKSTRCPLGWFQVATVQSDSFLPEPDNLKEICTDTKTTKMATISISKRMQFEKSKQISIFRAVSLD
ncbi:hypothetical protein [Rosistilla oblonga]|uniref:hypothetical protein n=1 Tax=Rosistilla oblonga TaxID=2527990 RepID=UPI003A9848F6